MKLVRGSIISVSSDCTLRIWDVSSGKSRIIATLPTYAYDFTVAEDQKVLFIVGWNETVYQVKFEMSGTSDFKEEKLETLFQVSGATYLM